ncbi:MAG: threonine-phosphate decarboxylase CobD [Magnetococcus sp. DMHC-1]|nr:threonine-phosphate decarboxylase [Magnetococcales bacterium]
MLEHGGQLRRMAHAYGIPPDNWLDLSTGINPEPWPVPSIPIRFWNRLPENADGLEEAAQAYFQTPHLLPTAGSQAIIQILPRLFPARKIGILAPTYAEYAQAWSGAGREVIFLPHDTLSLPPDHVDLLVVVNPNNPTGFRRTPEMLLSWAKHLARNERWLVVDEAFMDTTPEQTLSLRAGVPGLIILRSLGKFFGLAGARCGFLLAPPELLVQAVGLLGPWSIPGPSRFVATLALQDHAWQKSARLHLAACSRRLASLLARHNLPPSGSTDLFQWVVTPHARHLQDHLAKNAILVRAFDHPPSLRFGLPGNESAWERLEKILSCQVVQPGNSY